MRTCCGGWWRRRRRRRRRGKGKEAFGAQGPLPLHPDPLHFCEAQMGRWPAAGRSEGSSTPTIPHNRLRNRLRRAQHIHSRNPHHRNPQRPQRLIPPLVPQWPVAHIMGHAINLESDLYGRAIEIQHPIPNRMLPAKLHTIRLKSQMPPEQRFRQARLRAEPARQGNVTRLLWPRQEPLRHWLRQCHLPVCAAQKRGGPERDAANMAWSCPFSKKCRRTGIANLRPKDPPHFGAAQMGRWQREALTEG